MKVAGLEQDQGEWIYDLRDRPAVIIHVPRESSEEELVGFERELRSLAGAVADRDGDASRPAPPQVGRYQIGSAAEWTYTFAIVWEAAQYTPDIAAEIVDWAMRFEFLFIRLKPGSSEPVPEGSTEKDKPLSLRPTELAVTQPAIVSLALSHYHSKYGRVESVDVSWFMRGSQYIDSVSQPSGRETYTVDIHDETSHYVYVVTGKAEPLEHFLLSAGRLHPLEEPIWLGREPSNRFNVSASGFHAGRGRRESHQNL